MREFPPMSSVRHIYSIFLGEAKLPLFPITYKSMSDKELGIFYILEFLIGFMSIEVDFFYDQEGYLKEVRKGLFSMGKSFMADYLFKTEESIIKQTSLGV